MNARRPWLFVTGSPRTARSTGRRRSSRPASVRIAGRTNSSNVTADDTGLPGSPNEQDRRSAAGPRGCAERERLARLDRDAPQLDLADRLERRLHDVVRPDGDAARHDDRVDAADERRAQATEDVVESSAAIPRSIGSAPATRRPAPRSPGRSRRGSRPDRAPRRASGSRRRSRGSPTRGRRWTRTRPTPAPASEGDSGRRHAVPGRRGRPLRP